MDLAICHYSYHRSYKAGGWDPARVCAEVSALGVKAVDFHARLLGDAPGVVDQAQKALADYGLVLSGLSLNTNFNYEDDSAQQQMIADTRKWMKVAAELGAPVSRIFGGSLRSRDAEIIKQASAKVLSALRVLAPYAEELGLILAIENHGGLPCSAEEQVEMIEAVGSPYVRATVDVGNYMQCGQEGAVGTKIAAPYAAYVHMKDFKKVPDETKPWGWGIDACIVGQGAVDHKKCLENLQASGFNGYVALEYEGSEDESIGVPASVEYLKSIM